MTRTIYISAAHKSSGKTTISLGISAALTNQGKAVQTFKKGPDYIDPIWLNHATNQPCYNLDFFTMQRKEILELYSTKSLGSDAVLIEGNKGLYDGMDLQGKDCNAALAKLLQSPVILVIDCAGITRGIAPLLSGYLNFDQEVQIAGVILNRVINARHETKLNQVITEYCDIPVLGTVRRDKRLEIGERHLGLIPANEKSKSAAFIQQACEIVSEQVDLNRLLELGKPLLTTELSNLDKTKPTINKKIRIGILRDEVFGFYYPDDLEQLQNYGAELVFINALHQPQLPAIDGLFIGGGFPETNMHKLEENHSLRKDIQLSIENGLPCYAECGGLIYLSRSLSWSDDTAEMVGVIQGDSVMTNRPVGRGYVKLSPTDNHPWQTKTSETICAHEFHYSQLENIDPSLKYAYQVERGFGINGKQDGLIYKNLLANYSHLRNNQQNPWVGQFIGFIQEYQNLSQNQ